MDGGEAPRYLLCWMESPGSREAALKVIGSLAAAAPTTAVDDVLRAETGDGAAALCVADAVMAERPEACQDERRAWLWAAASLGNGMARNLMAAEVLAELNSSAPRREPDALAALARRWLTIGQRTTARADTHEGGGRGPLAKLNARAGRQRREEIQAPDRLQPPQQQAEDGCIAIHDIGDPGSREGQDVAARYAHAIGIDLPFGGTVPPPGVAYSEINGAWPWAENVARYVEGQLSLLRNYGSARLRLPPLLLVGPPGTGKTTLLERISIICGIPSTTIPCGGISDAGGLGAVTRGWASARASAPVQAIADSGYANPALILDELDKGSEVGSRNGSVMSILLSMLSGPSAYWDACLLAPTDMSNVTFMASANSLRRLPDSLLDRFLVLQVPRPSPKHFELVLANVRAAAAARLGVDERFLPWLGAGDMEWLRGIFVAQDCSIRALETAHSVLSGERAMEEAQAMAFPN